MTTVAVTADTILVRDNEPMPTTVDEEVVVLSVRAGAYFGFNRIGTEIWNGEWAKSSTHWRSPMRSTSTP